MIREGMASGHMQVSPLKGDWDPVEALERQQVWTIENNWKVEINWGPTCCCKDFCHLILNPLLLFPNIGPFGLTTG